jgi:hypothetical protein
VKFGGEKKEGECNDFEKMMIKCENVYGGKDLQFC